MKECGIYRIESVSFRNRIYIGSSVDIATRWTMHLQRLRKNKHHSMKLQRHYNKYGEADLKHSTLVRCEEEDLMK